MKMLTAVILTLFIIAVPASADNGGPDGSGAEDIHIESLLAQSVGIERRLQNQNLFFADRDVEDYLTEILLRLATPEERSLYRLRVRVLQGNAVNAFAAQHGSVFVTTAMLARIGSEAQLAALLAHELTHIANHHAARNLLAMKESARRQLPARQGIALLLGDGVAGSVTGAALRSAISGYNRELEREADSVGLLRMVSAGFPHQEFYNLFAMLSGYLEAENIKEPYFFSSHPRMVERIENYRRIVSGGLTDSAGNPVEAGGGYQPDNIDREYFSLKIRSVILHDAEMNRAAGKFYIADEQIERLLAVDTADAAALVMRGDMERMLARRSTAFTEWYERALRSDPGNLAALRAMGYAYHAIGDGEKAREYLQRYCDLAGDTAFDIKMAREALRRSGGGGAE